MYRRRLMFKRSWVWIPAPDTGFTFLTQTSCRNCIVFKIPKINEKEAWDGPFLKYLFSHYAAWVSATIVCTVYFWDNKVIIAREPWSGGYGKRLTFRRLWVWIQVPYTGWTFFSYICCKICNVCLKRTKISKKEAGVGPFLKNKVIICLNCWGGEQTQNSF